MAASLFKTAPNSNARPGTGSKSLALAWIVRVLSLAMVYWVAGRLAQLMAIPPGYATAVWPAAGFALVGILVWGWRVAPGIALGSLLVDLGTSFDASSTAAIMKSFAVAATIGCGAAVQAILGALLVRRFVGFPTALQNERDIAAFTILGGPVACLANPTIAVTTLCIAGIVPSSDYMFNWWTWWVGDTIGVLIFAQLSLIFMTRLPRSVWRRRRVIIGVTLVAGFALVTMLFLRVNSWEERQLRWNFNRNARPIGNALESMMGEYEDVVSSVAGLLDSSPGVTRKAFREFVQRPLKKHRGILGLGWDPVVRGGERAAYEESARRDGLREFQFTERDPNGGLQRAPARSEYAAVFYLEPSEPNDRALGFDIASDPVRFAALKKARETGNPIATSRVSLVQEGAEEDGVLLVVPVFGIEGSDNPARGSRQIRGYAVGVFRIADVIECVLGEVGGNGMDLKLIDESDPRHGQLLYDSRSPSTERRAQPANGASEAARWSHSFEFGERRWRLEVTPHASFMTGNRSWQAWMVLAAGLFFVGLLVVIMLLTTGRTSLVQEIADQMRNLSRELIRVQETERKHLSRELHDEIGQNLTALKINMQIVKNSSTPDASRLDDSIVIVDRILREVRDLSLSLRPPLLDEAGLVAALRAYLKDQSDRCGFPIDFRSTIDGTPLTPNLSLTLFRIVQEALTNVIRHAKAQHVSISLFRNESDEIELSMHDNGMGFELQSAKNSASGRTRLGLIGMEERAAQLGGVFTVRSIPGAGTAISVRIPLQSVPCPA